MTVRRPVSELVNIGTACPPRVHVGSDGIRNAIVRVQAATLLWMLVECSVALYAAARARSVALLAFGSDSLVELLSASLVLMQFGSRWRIAPGTAGRLAGWLLFVLAGVVVAVSASSLYFGVHAEQSVLGLAVTAGALVLMPLLAALKRKKARETGNVALAADATQSATCAYLAACTLSSLLIGMLFHIRWIDSVAALCAVPVLVVEGRRALQGKGCGCC
jgi:divalent metal cation (Fe/Co/Zn/Cd) transporter